MPFLLTALCFLKDMAVTPDIGCDIVQQMGVAGF